MDAVFAGMRTTRKPTAAAARLPPPLAGHSNGRRFPLDLRGEL